MHRNRAFPFYSLHHDKAVPPFFRRCISEFWKGKITAFFHPDYQRIDLHPFSGIILDAAKRAATMPSEISTQNSAPVGITLIHG
jgi:hypothetical protein